jgi:hypothetical protein
MGLCHCLILSSEPSRNEELQIKKLEEKEAAFGILKVYLRTSYDHYFGKGASSRDWSGANPIKPFYGCNLQIFVIS